MVHIEKKENCCGCHACAQICPKHCITMRADTEGFLYPQVDATACIHCGACEKVCPILQSSPEPKDKSPKAFAAINLDEKVRAQSSSGGVFSLLAEQTIFKGGVVFGAAMSENQHKVCHIAVETLEGLAALRGSKYLQSEIGTTYSQAKEALQSGREVLFSGTPCQIEGLRSFLQKDYPNLLCADVICHGVPSPRTWNVYLSEIERAVGQKATWITFRKKSPGWKHYSMHIQFPNGKVFSKDNRDSPYMRAFLQDVSIRPSCYACRFKKLNHVSDITLADYWGIQNQYPDMDDDKGTSLVLVHSEKGQQRMDALRDSLRLQEVPVTQALKPNPAMTQSAKPHKRRQEFFEHLGTMPFDKLVARYCRKPFSFRSTVAGVLRKLGLIAQVKALFLKLHRSA